MRADFVLKHALLHQMTRREAVESTAKAGAVGALAGLGLGAQSASAGHMTAQDGGRKAAPNGTPHLVATYRITVEDLEAAMRRARIKTVKRGDEVLGDPVWGPTSSPYTRSCSPTSGPESARRS